MTLRVGCVADDFTGAADVANAFRRAGLRTALLFGLPVRRPPADGCEAVVVTLKSRTIPAQEAVRQSLAAADALVGELGAGQVYFKYCSTFDSTREGNIGPVAEALAERLDPPVTVVCPASPENGRTVYQGHLFVGDRLLAETPMRHHPLTPMTESDLRRVLGAQVDGAVGLVPLPVVTAGPGAVRAALEDLAGSGTRCAVVDATSEDDLVTLGEACATLPLVTGAAGLAWGLGRALASRAGVVHPPADVPTSRGPAAIIAGSCSARTLEQVAHARARLPALSIDPQELADGGDVERRAVAWIDEHVGAAPLLLYSSAPPEALRAVQERVGRQRAAALLEALHGTLAHHLVARGVRRLVVAGGETAGAVVSALGVDSVVVGPEADPGVPWLFAAGDDRLELLLKSGNFGSPDLFTRALE